MPRSAIASGCIDFVLSPAEIGVKIVEIAKQERTVGARGGAPRLPPG